MTETIPKICTVCSAEALEIFSRSVVLKRYEARFFLCRACGFVCSEEPFWLEEAYAEAITGSDVGLVQRNIQLAAVATVLISTFFARAGRFIDYAGGYGMFVRLMRDNGFMFSWHDKYCRNEFARGFEGDADAGPYELLTAFEVFEHLVDPVAELSAMLAYSDSILFTTQLLPEPAPRPEEWWFYGLEHGQHISFFTRTSLEVLGARFGLKLYTNGRSMHLLTKRRLNGGLFALLARYNVSRFLSPFCHGKSLLPSDYHAVTGGDLSP